MFEANRQHLMNTDALADDIERKTIELKMEARRVYDQRNALNRVVTKQARDEHLYDCIRQAAASLNGQAPLVSPTPAANGYSENDAVLCLADWHYGMTTRNLYNRYDPQVCRERVEKLAERVIERLQLHRVRTLHTFLLGDFAHGAIHTGVRVESVENVCEQLMHVSEMIAELLVRLSCYVENIDVFSTYGNHMRTVQNKKDSVHTDNMERIIPWWLKERLCGCQNIHIASAEADEFIRINVCGKNIVAAHGDLEDFSRMGVTMNTLFSRQCGHVVDYCIMADKHHMQAADNYGIETILVPSLCGTDSYANGKRLYSDPAQTLLIFNEECGCDARYHINLK